jgi:small-conductance mechanosensitive channel
MDEGNVLEGMKAFLSKQVSSYEAVLALCNEQVECAKRGDTKALMGVLSKKQRFITDVEQLKRDSSAMLDEWALKRNTFSVEEKYPLEKLHSRLKELLGEIMQIEESSKDSLSDSMNQNSSQVVNMQRGKQMLKAYGAPAPSASRFTDKKK